MIRASCIAVLLSWSTAASAQTVDEKKRCGDAYQQAQYLRLDNKLIAAKDQLKICIQPACPDVATKDCARWLDEVERATPSVVLRFVDASGADRNDVTVSMDGEPLASTLDGSAIAIDPGPHTFVFTPAGGEAVEQQATIAQGQKLREVAVILPRAAPEPTTETAPPAMTTSDDGIHPAAWVLYGVAALGLGAFAALGVHSLGQEDCEPRCSDAQIDDIHLSRIVADVSLGVGVLALGGAIWITVASLDDGDVAVGVSGVRISF